MLRRLLEMAVKARPLRIWSLRQQISERRLIEAAEILAADLSEDEQVAALRHRGFGEGEAHRLVALLPMAFCRPILEDLGVRHFVMRLAATGMDGTSVKADLMRQPEYVAGLRLARKHYKAGTLNPLVYERIVMRSADFDAASNALNSGANLSGATIGSALNRTEIARHLLR